MRQGRGNTGDRSDITAIEQICQIIGMVVLCLPRLQLFRKCEIDIANLHAVTVDVREAEFGGETA